jgi:hypothetical protein
LEFPHCSNLPLAFYLDLVQCHTQDFAAADVGAASANCADGGQVRRILTLALVLECWPRSEAATRNGTDRKPDRIGRSLLQRLSTVTDVESRGMAPQLKKARPAPSYRNRLHGPAQKV